MCKKFNYTITFTEEQVALITQYAEEHGILTNGVDCQNVDGVVMFALERLLGYKWRHLKCENKGINRD